MLYLKQPNRDLGFQPAEKEISTASNLPQKEIGKYIKILGEALKLSQPINSNSISVHMPRFCNLLQLNKSAQELAAHIGEVVINKCFCTRRNPISISAAAIYLACQLEDKRKTQAEICKVTGLTEVTLRKVYKELLENWDDLLPLNYTPAVPPEKAFPMTAITSSRTAKAPDASTTEASNNLPVLPEKEKKPGKTADASEMDLNNNPRSTPRASVAGREFYQAALWQRQFPFGTTTTTTLKTSGEKERNQVGGTNDEKCSPPNSEMKIDKGHTSNVSTAQASGAAWQFGAPSQAPKSSVSKPGKQQVEFDQSFGQQGAGM